LKNECKEAALAASAIGETWKTWKHKLLMAKISYAGFF